jgi:hypothetical protein
MKTAGKKTITSVFVLFIALFLTRYNIGNQNIRDTGRVSMSHGMAISTQIFLSKKISAYYQEKVKA